MISLDYDTKRQLTKIADAMDKRAKVEETKARAISSLATSAEKLVVVLVKRLDPKP